MIHTPVDDWRILKLPVGGTVFCSEPYEKMTIFFEILEKSCSFFI